MVVLVRPSAMVLTSLQMLASGSAGGGVDADVTAVGGTGGGGGGVDVDVTAVGCIASGGGGGGVNVDATAVGGRPGGGAGGGADADVTAVGGRAGGSASGGVGPGAAVSSDVDVVVRSTAIVVEVVVGCAPATPRLH